MKNKPLVSIIMPVFNGEQTIELAIKSLMIQTYENWKCIIVNDGSKDKTASILEKYNSDSRFKIIHLKKNKGRGYARQIALENAEGDYLAFLDADDFYHPMKLQKQVEYLNKKKNLSLIATGIGSFDKAFKLRTVRAKGNLNEFKHKYGKKFHQLSPASSMLKLSEARRINYKLNLKVAEDVEFLNRYLNNKFYTTLNDVLYYYFEIDNISSKKIIQYYILGIKSDFYTMRTSFVLGFISFIKTIIKFFLYFTFLPIKGANYFIIKRGNKPNLQEISEFQKTLILINK